MELNQTTTTPEMLLITLGEPDDDCEICRAHGVKAAPGVQGPQMIVQPLGPHDVSACHCPVCIIAKEEMPFRSLKAGWGGR